MFRQSSILTAHVPSIRISYLSRGCSTKSFLEDMFEFIRIIDSMEIYPKLISHQTDQQHRFRPKSRNFHLCKLKMNETLKFLLWRIFMIRSCYQNLFAQAFEKFRSSCIIQKKWSIFHQTSFESCGQQYFEHFSQSIFLLGVKILKPIMLKFS